MKELTRFPPTPRAKDATERVTRLAERQFGVISGTQWLACGIPNSKIGRWLDQERLHRVFRGVYAVGHRAKTTEARLAAALLLAGPGACSVIPPPPGGGRLFPTCPA